MRRRTDERDARWRGSGLVSLALTLALLGGASGTGSCCDGTDAGGAGEATRAAASAATAPFLGPDDFEGEFEPRDGDAAWGGEAIYLGRVVFLHLARTEVAKVLPSGLQLAANESASLPDLHPVILLFGHQTETKLVYPFWTPEAGDDYNELILLVPFVQRLNHLRWHNYVVRMYLDNDDAIQIGNLYYGYFKQRAVLTEVAPTVTLSELDVTRSLQTVFEWTAQNPSGGFVPSTSAMATLDNYQDAIEIMSMPLLGTLFGTAYICSYWDWNLQNADVRSIKVTSRFLQPPRAGTASWVSQGPVASDEKFAFEIRGLVWQMAFPALPCSF